MIIILMQYNLNRTFHELLYTHVIVLTIFFNKRNTIRNYIQTWVTIKQYYNAIMKTMVYVV